MNIEHTRHQHEEQCSSSVVHYQVIPKDSPEWGILLLRQLPRKVYDHLKLIDVPEYIRWGYHQYFNAEQRVACWVGTDHSGSLWSERTTQFSHNWGYLGFRAVDPNSGTGDWESL